MLLLLGCPSCSRRHDAAKQKHRHPNLERNEEIECVVTVCAISQRVDESYHYFIIFTLTRLSTVQSVNIRRPEFPSLHSGNNSDGHHEPGFNEGEYYLKDGGLVSMRSRDIPVRL